MNILTLDRESSFWMAKTATKDERIELVDAVGEFFYDPLGFVFFAFDWGTGELAGEDGPDDWQVKVLTEISAALQKGEIDVQQAVQIAVASGHGIGKTALVCWLILWFMSTRPNPQVIVTANTETQLNTKTWRELAKWHKLSVNKDWFNWTATKFYHVAHPETWFAAAIPWSVNRSEAFAGAHEKHVLMIFDEASAIHDVIWETADGAMTSAGAMWFAFGNPTRNAGRFKECFGKYKHRWLTMQIDSRNAKKADQNKISQWIEDYGEDSDFVRVRVRGVFPRAGSNQFIGSDIVEMCRKYKAEGYDGFAKILGVDVARFGDDQSVLIVRQGRHVSQPTKHRGLDTMQTADKVVEKINDVDYVMIDGVGVGGGVVDRLKQLGHGPKVIDVNAGSRPLDPAKYFNKRAEMWGLMRDYLSAGAQIPDDNELIADLTNPEYGFTPTQQIQIEKKDDMKKRGLASPDCGDALALTFSRGFNMPKRDDNEIPNWGGRMRAF